MPRMNAKYFDAQMKRLDHRGEVYVLGAIAQRVGMGLPVGKMWLDHVIQKAINHGYGR